MASERYPLHAAERLRNAQRAQAEHALLRAQAECARARADVAHAEQLLSDHLAAATAARLDPAASISGTAPALRGDASISGLELQRAAAFAQRHATRARALRERLGAARALASGHELALRHAQRALAEARSGEQVLEHDRARFEGAQRREREHAEQAEIDEQVEQARLEQTRKDWGR